MIQLPFAVLTIHDEKNSFLNSITCNTYEASKNAFLDRHGKIISTFYQKHIDQHTMLLLIPQATFVRTMEHVMEYVKLSSATIQKKPWKVYFDCDGDGLGLHLIEETNGQLIVLDNEFPDTTSEEEFTLFRLDNSIPLQGVDYDREMILNVSPSFVAQKGCYLGQEVVTRISHRAKAPKKLVVVNVAECTEEQKGRITSSCQGKGFLFVRNE